jgi:tRNA G18 (ribose-2'-O)-methylase SpoU
MLEKNLIQIIRQGQLLEEAPNQENFELFSKKMQQLQGNPKFDNLYKKFLELPSNYNHKQLLTILVPLERELKKTPKEYNFGITTADQSSQKRQILPLTIVLDNLRSAFNTGSLFRLGECLGVSEIILCGYTATPDHEQVRKSSMGTDVSVPWRHFSRVEKAISTLREEDEKRKFIAFETSLSSGKIQESKFSSPSVFIFGNERYGLDNEILSLCDTVLEIPMLGTKNSLNVSQAASICVYEFSRQFQS